jgi:hypothetical protein
MLIVNLTNLQLRSIKLRWFGKNFKNYQLLSHL